MLWRMDCPGKPGRRGGFDAIEAERFPCKGQDNLLKYKVAEFLKG